MKIFLILVLLLIYFPVKAEDKDLAKVFNGINGTIVIHSLNSKKYYSHNDERAKQRFFIASTFKIFNTLIALQENVIKPDDILKWDGKIYEFANWNKDQTLESAFKESCVWCYQELAKRIGNTKYQTYITNAQYGVLNQPFNTTTFWLDGSLKVSAVDQIEFLKKVYLKTLPFNAEHYDTLKHIMMVKHTPEYTLYAKTGWATRLNPKIGWYVGYVETKNDVWFFALNIVINQDSNLALRQTLTEKALHIKKII